MSEAYIVAAVRTAGGRRGGRLAGVHPVDLAAISLMPQGLFANLRPLPRSRRSGATGAADDRGGPAALVSLLASE